MKQKFRLRLIVIFLITVVLVTACGSSEKTNFIQDPKRENASKRTEIGSVFYQDDQQIGIYIGGVGTFIYDIENNKLTHGVWVEELLLKIIQFGNQIFIG